MENSVRVWQPSSDRLGNVALSVPYPGPLEQMNRQVYQDLLEKRLRQLVQQDPKEAERLLKSSEEHLPDLYQVALAGQPQEWPAQMMESGQMQTRLNQIDWSQTGQIVELPQNELPDLEEIVEALVIS